MLMFPRWKILLTFFFCILGFAFSAPNLLTSNQLSKLPPWLQNTLNLGLDLRGGSHLLLQTDYNNYLQAQLDALKESVRKELREAKIGYIALKVSNNSVSFQQRETANTDQIKNILKKTNSGIIFNNDSMNWVISYSEPYLHELKNNLIEQSIEIVRRRIDEHGTKEPIIQKQGETNILLQVPGLYDPQELKLLLGKTAKMSFHIVNDVVDKANVHVPPGQMLLASDEDKRIPTWFVVPKTAEITGEQLEDARTSFNNFQQPTVFFKFNILGGKKFGELTSKNVGKRLAIVLDNKVISAPVINEPIMGGQGTISGRFTVKDANDLALMLRAGALPSPLQVIEEKTVGPSLGNDSIMAGKIASIYGIIGVMIFMFLCYGLFGIFANISLVVNIAIMTAILSLLQATLTLPGIAAIVLTVGMAVDTNVLIFERMREESMSGLSLPLSIERGFKHAFTTILDSNLTSIFAAMLLYYFGTGPVKSFSIPLIIGIATSMFTAITLSKLLIYIWFNKFKPKKLGF